MSRYCFVEFSIFDDVKFERLLEIVCELGEHKVSERIEDETYWRSKFLVDELSCFTQLTASEMVEWNKFWSSTPLPLRHSAEMPSPGWDFDSMIDAIYNGNYALQGVRRIEENIGVLEIDPFGWPYGGIDCLKALVRCFGHQILGYYEGSSPYVVGDPQPPIRTPGLKV